MFRGFRGSFAFAFLSLALLLGQHAVLLHDLGHAIERNDGGIPAEKSCDKHYLCAQLGTAVGSYAPVVPQAEPGSQAVVIPQAQGASQRTRLAYRSQAPPSASRVA